MKSRIQLRRGLSTAWEANNPVLAAGEQGYETDTKSLKIGDGVTAWNALNYFITSGGGDSFLNPPISVTYAELTSLVGTSGLDAGQKYRITDRGNAIVEATSTSTYRPYQDCIGGMDWDWSIDLTTAQTSQYGPYDITYCDEVRIYGDGGSYPTIAIMGGILGRSVRFTAYPDLDDAGNHTYTFTGTPLASMTAASAGYFLWSGSAVLDSTYKDWIELELIEVVEPDTSTTITVWKEKSRSIYV